MAGKSWGNIFIESQATLGTKLSQANIIALFPYFKGWKLAVGGTGRALTHSVVVKTRSQTVLVKQSFFFLSIFFLNPHPFPFNAWPSVGASWASPERCNKAADGWGLPQQLYPIKLSHWALPDPSHMIRSIKHGHNSHLSSGDNDGVKLA